MNGRICVMSEINFSFFSLIGQISENKHYIVEIKNVEKVALRSTNNSEMNRNENNVFTLEVKIIQVNSFPFQNE